MTLPPQWSLFPLLCNHVPCLTEQLAHIFPSLSSTSDVLMETLLNVFDIPGQMQSYLVFLLLPRYLSWLPLSTCFLFVFEFGQELLVHPCRPPSIFA